MGSRRRAAPPVVFAWISRSWLITSAEHTIDDRRQTVSTGVTNAKRLKRTYASEEDAQAAASLSASLAWGNPLLSPGMKITATGFKSMIDATPWLISSAEHSMDGRGGLKTRIEMEVVA